MAKSKEAAYALARERYAALGVDTDKAIRVLLATPISLQCWQGDDCSGFEGAAALSGGILATGNYPGRATNGDELRADLTQALSLLPGRNRVSLHGMYAETNGARVDRDQIEPAHFSRWMDWAREHTAGLDMNATFFSHPKSASGFTLANRDKGIRDFWIAHAIACRRIAAHMGRAQKSPCVNNIWIPDGYKDMPADRATPRALLKDSLDRILAVPISRKECLDAVEGKLFGLASESYVVGSQEFYLGYAISKNILMCLDMGHFHPTEDVGDKISSLMLFLEGVLLHVSRGVRWDSDHAPVTEDSLNRLMAEIVRGGFLPRVKIATDFFDASINRIGAWAVGARATQKALLRALCEPSALLRRHEAEGDFTGRLMLHEEAAMLPLGAVWDQACRMSDVPVERELFEAVRRHERTVLAPRARAALPANHANALEELMHVSHAVGGQTRFVQAGGGNTSVKAADGTLMFIKSSGTPLAEMDARRGWVLVETGTLRELFDKRELLSKPASAREAEVARILGRSVVAPAEARPSVEAPLHALLDRVVIHTHPPAVNALTCNNRSKELLEKLWRKDEEQPLWVPYTDPGVMLAFRARELIEKYRRLHGRLPRIILLENHGLICSAERATDALQLHLSVIDRIERSFAKGEAEDPIALMVAHSVGKVAGAAMQARRFVFPQPAMDARAHAAVFTGALTPDHVVYSGPKPCVVEEPVYEARLSAAVKRYRKEEGALPRIILLGAQGTWVVAENEKKLAAAQELFASAVASSLLAGGDLKPLGPREVSFIMNWEAEHYRAKVMEKPSPAR
jgi:L-rhamnose isomerase